MAAQAAHLASPTCHGTAPRVACATPVVLSYTPVTVLPAACYWIAHWQQRPSSNSSSGSVPRRVRWRPLMLRLARAPFPARPSPKLASNGSSKPRTCRVPKHPAQRATRSRHMQATRDSARARLTCLPSVNVAHFQPLGQLVVGPLQFGNGHLCRL